MAYTPILYRIINIELVLFILLLGLNMYCVGDSLVQSTREVEIEVFERLHPDGAVYEYKVTNSSNDEIVSIDVGFDSWIDSPELTVLPVGWKNLSSRKIAGISSPQGWEGLVIVQEESTKHWINWRIKTETHRGLFNGRNIQGFKVCLSRRDEAYTRCHFMVTTRRGHQYKGSVIHSSK